MKKIVKTMFLYISIFIVVLYYYLWFFSERWIKWIIRMTDFNNRAKSYIKKFLKRTLYLILITGFIQVMLEFYFNQKKVYLQSLDSSKTITVYRTFYQTYSRFYLIPYKYKSFLPPKDNYCIAKTEEIIEFTGSMYFGGIAINWYPSGGSYLKISADCTINKLNEDIKVVLFDGEVYDVESEKRSPKYTYASFDDLFSSSHLRSSMFFFGITFLLLLVFISISFLIILALLIIALISLITARIKKIKAISDK